MKKHNNQRFYRNLYPPSSIPGSPKARPPSFISTLCVPAYTQVGYAANAIPMVKGKDSLSATVNSQETKFVVSADITVRHVQNVPANIGSLINMIWRRL